jgi:hypothetical protein
VRMVRSSKDGLRQGDTDCCLGGGGGGRGALGRGEGWRHTKMDGRGRNEGLGVGKGSLGQYVGGPRVEA